MTDEPVFSDRATRDEDARADALAFADAGDIELLQQDEAAEQHARLCFLLEATFNEYERRHAEAPDTLKPIPNYPEQIPGTYGADVTPCFLQVMHELMARYASAVAIDIVG